MEGCPGLADCKQVVVLCDEGLLLAFLKVAVLLVLRLAYLESCVSDVISNLH